MMKNTVIAAPTWVKLRPKSRMSHGNSGGITKWKKCEVAWAKPTSEMTVASWRSDAAGKAADTVVILRVDRENSNDIRGDVHETACFARPARVRRGSVVRHAR